MYGYCKDKLHLIAFGSLMVKHNDRLIILKVVLFFPFLFLSQAVRIICNLIRTMYLLYEIKEMFHFKKDYQD